MYTRRQSPPTTSASSTSTSGSLRASRVSISPCNVVIESAPLRKKSGRAPTFGTTAGACAPARKLYIEHSIAPGAERARGRRCDARPRRADRSLLGLQIACFAQRHDRRLVVAVVEQLTAALVEVVHALHARKLNVRRVWQAGARVRPVRARGLTTGG